MQNVGAEQFDYGTFKASYDTDPRVKTMTHNFNNKGIELKTKKNVEMDITTIQAAYVMGGMTMSLSLKEIENADYLQDKDEKETIFAVAMAF